VNIFTCTIHAEHTRNEFYRTLSIRGTNFIACWAYWEPISSHAEHARKCLKVEYLGQIEYDFQKSRVTCPWDHKVSVSAKKSKTNFHACVPLRCGEFCLGTLCSSSSPQWFSNSASRSQRNTRVYIFLKCFIFLKGTWSQDRIKIS
jgi:hypothetical protein